MNKITEKSAFGVTLAFENAEEVRGRHVSGLLEVDHQKDGTPLRLTFHLIVNDELSEKSVTVFDAPSSVPSEGIFYLEEGKQRFELSDEVGMIDAERIYFYNLKSGLETDIPAYHLGSLQRIMLGQFLKSSRYGLPEEDVKETLRLKTDQGVVKAFSFIDPVTVERPAMH